MIERFNRTIKEKMFQYFSANNTRKYVDILDLLVNQYNNSIHLSIKMTQNEASRKETKIKYGEIYTKNWVVRPYHQTFSISDNVRITKKGKYLIKDTLKDGRKRFSRFLKFN